jgi:hypothetical protein
MLTLLILFAIMIVVIPFAYMAYAVIPYSEYNSISSIPKWERHLLRAICFYPALPLIMMFAEPIISEPHYVKDNYGGAIIFTAAHLVISTIAAACSKYVFAAGRWASVLFGLNVLLACCYGYGLVGMLLRFR